MFETSDHETANREEKPRALEARPKSLGRAGGSRASLVALALAETNGGAECLHRVLDVMRGTVEGTRAKDVLDAASWLERLAFPATERATNEASPLSKLSAEQLTRLVRLASDS